VELSRIRLACPPAAPSSRQDASTRRAEARCRPSSTRSVAPHRCLS
jgi:hypothetical protein